MCTCRPRMGRAERSTTWAPSRRCVTQQGRVGNKVGQVIMLLRTSTQEADAAPYGLQLMLVDFEDLNSEFKAAYS